MSSKEDYLDSLLESVNSSGQSADKAAAKNSSAVQTNYQGNTALDAEKNKDTDDDDFDSEDLEFPELAALFAEDEEETADTVSESVETGAEPAESGSVETESEPAPSESVEAESEPAPSESVEAESEPAESESIQAEPESAVQASLSEPAVETVPLRDIEDMDIAELEAMLSGIPADTTAAEETVSITAPEKTADAAEIQTADSDLAEISELLGVSDNQDAVSEDMAEIEAMLAATQTEDSALQQEAVKGAEDAAVSSEETDAESKKKRRKEKREEKKERKKKEKQEKRAKKQKDAEEKKPGILKRFLKFLTEDDEISDLEAELGQIDLSEENIAILESLNNESEKGGKKEKKSLFKKKEKTPKEKKEKAAKKEKKPKEKKPKEKKPKKEKAPKPVVPEAPLKPIGKKKIITGALLGVTVFGMILICTSYIPDTIDKQESKKAFEDGDFEKVYQLLVTKKLTPGKEKLLKGATLCLQLERKLDSYENYKKLEGMEMEQLDALISGVGKYQRIQDEAVQYGVAEPMKNSYLSILGILQSEYGVSEEQAKELALETDSVAYTKGLMQILGMEIPTAEEEDRR